MDFDYRNSHRAKCNVLEKCSAEEMKCLETHQEKANNAVADLDRAITHCNEALMTVRKNEKKVKTCIDNTLKQVKEHLLAQIEAICSGKVKGLQKQVVELQRVRDGLSLASKMITEAQSQTPAQQLSTKKGIAVRITKLVEEFNHTQLVPSRNPVLTTSIARPSHTSSIIRKGCISGGSHPGCSTCDADYVPFAVVGVLRTIKVVAKDNGGKSWGYSGEVVTATLRSKDLAVTGETFDHGDGTYSVSFTPQLKGDHKLEVTLTHQHIKGSPFVFYVAQPRKTPYIKLRLSMPHSFTTNSSPYDVAVTQQGYLVVPEYKYQTVTIYDDGGSKKHSFGNANHHGKENGQLHSPSAVAIRGDYLYICELGNNRIQKFSISKKCFISKFGKPGSGDGEFNNPTGICIDPQGRVFVADRDNDRIQVFDDGNNFVNAFHCLQKPWGLTFDLQGRLHVTAWGSNCIHVFSQEGHPLTNYGSETLNGPTGIAVNGEGHIAISESGQSNRFLIFSPGLTLLHVVSGEFGAGRGIVCDKDGYFWVADSDNNCLGKY